MGQWTNSNIHCTVPDGPFLCVNMSKCAFDPKKKNPYWFLTFITTTSVQLIIQQDLKEQTSIYLVHTKIHISIPGSCDTANLYYIVPASVERNGICHNQYFTPALLAEDLTIIIFIQTQATEKALILKVYSSIFGH